MIKTLFLLLLLAGQAHAGSKRVTITNSSDQEVPVANFGRPQALVGRYFVTTTDLQTALGGENEAFLVVNSSTQSISLHLDVFSITSSDGAALRIRVYGDPVIISSGTPLLIRNTNSNFTNASQAEAFINATVSDFGVLAFEMFTAANTVFSIGGKTIVAPGSTILLTTTPQGSNKDFIIDLSWVEQ